MDPIVVSEKFHRGEEIDVEHITLSLLEPGVWIRCKQAKSPNSGVTCVVLIVTGGGQRPTCYIS